MVHMPVQAVLVAGADRISLWHVYVNDVTFAQRSNAAKISIASLSRAGALPALDGDKENSDLRQQADAFPQTRLAAAKLPSSIHEPCLQRSLSEQMHTLKPGASEEDGSLKGRVVVKLLHQVGAEGQADLTLSSDILANPNILPLDHAIDAPHATGILGTAFEKGL